MGLTDGTGSAKKFNLQFIYVWMNTQIELYQVYLHLKVPHISTTLHNIPERKNLKTRYKEEKLLPFNGFTTV